MVQQGLILLLVAFASWAFCYNMQPLCPFSWITLPYSKHPPQLGGLVRDHRNDIRCILQLQFLTFCVVFFLTKSLQGHACISHDCLIPLACSQTVSGFSFKDYSAYFGRNPYLAEHKEYHLTINKVSPL